MKMSIRRISIENVIKMLQHSTNGTHKTYKVFFQLVLLLDLPQYQVRLRELGFQQLFFQVSVFEDLLQVLEDVQEDL